ncbi:hypothetical protein JD969_07465 [Planctomycetota bacterium]|nr:hypothetical protein JD969_07465 [Planctomycetota bacterium]
MPDILSTIFILLMVVLFAFAFAPLFDAILMITFRLLFAALRLLGLNLLASPQSTETQKS